MLQEEEYPFVIASPRQLALASFSRGEAIRIAP
jgi:hypothetical protein